MTNRIRHWKQKYDPKAALVFAKRLRMGDNPEKPFVLPGQRLTKKMRDKLGANRVKHWFENGTLEIANFKPVEKQREVAIAARDTA